MRGTSKRKEPADWIIRLAANNVPMDSKRRASFYDEFTKHRDDAGERERLLNWTFITENEWATASYILKDPQESDVSTGLILRFANHLIAENQIKKNRDQIMSLPRMDILRKNNSFLIS
jgi:hypothetical protein